MGKSTAGVDAIAGDILINGGTLGYGSARDNQIKDSSKLTLTSGTFAIGSRIETIGEAATATSGLAMSGGGITIAGGALTVANSATMTGGTTTITSSGNFILNTDFNFSGGTINSTYSGATASGVNLRAGSGTGITYSSSGTSTAQITNTGGGAFRVSLNTSGSTVFNIADSASVSTEMIISAPIIGGTASGIQKSGAGVLVLSGANTYSGPTVVTGGALFVSNTSGSGTSAGAVTVSNSGTTLGGSVRITGAVSVASGSNLSPGWTGIGTTAVFQTGALTLSSTSNFNVDLNGATLGSGYDQATVTGSVSITGSNLKITLGSGFTPSNQRFVIVSNDLTDAIIGAFGSATGVPSGYTIDYFYNDATNSLTGRERYRLGPCSRALHLGGRGARVIGCRLHPAAANICTRKTDCGARNGCGLREARGLPQRLPTAGGKLSNSEAFREQAGRAFNG